MQLGFDLLMSSLLVQLKQNTPIMRVMYREGPEGAPYHSLCLDGLIDGPMATGDYLPLCVPLSFSGILPFFLPLGTPCLLSCGRSLSEFEITSFKGNHHLTILCAILE